ncbi:MAG: hypothetical protein LV479_01565 [Methylacidiphilales bacterium]|nr:hypothetical protein [Candidatus Methylacidiphilales bacterium]
MGSSLFFANCNGFPYRPRKMEMIPLKSKQGSARTGVSFCSFLLPSLTDLCLIFSMADK